MADIKCPVCEKMIKRERFSEWVSRWGEDEWSSPEWRRFLICEIEDGQKLKDKLAEIEPIYEKQALYIKDLERQLELLQKTLEIVEKFSRPIVIPGDKGVIHNGRG